MCDFFDVCLMMLKRYNSSNSCNGLCFSCVEYNSFVAGIGVMDYSSFGSFYRFVFYGKGGMVAILLFIILFVVAMLVT